MLLGALHGPRSPWLQDPKYHMGFEMTHCVQRTIGVFSPAGKKKEEKKKTCGGGKAQLLFSVLYKVLEKQSKHPAGCLCRYRERFEAFLSISCL